ncbi:MAG: hypothetical protein QNJ91_09100 [Gammaproteobacteria bacterium]|nr:hypothetical protein [Gammaproteobacteria bacterium]
MTALAAMTVAAGVAASPGEYDRDDYYERRGPMPFGVLDLNSDGKVTADEHAQVRKERRALRAERGYLMRRAPDAAEFPCGIGDSRRCGRAACVASRWRIRDRVRRRQCNGAPSRRDGDSNRCPAGPRLGAAAAVPCRSVVAVTPPKAKVVVVVAVASLETRYIAVAIVMAGAADQPAGTFLGAREAAPFAARQESVLGIALGHAIDAALLFAQLPGLAARQVAEAQTLADAFRLTVLAPVEALLEALAARRVAVAVARRDAVVPDLAPVCAPVLPSVCAPCLSPVAAPGFTSVCAPCLAPVAAPRLAAIAAAVRAAFDIAPAASLLVALLHQVAVTVATIAAVAVACLGGAGDAQGGHRQRGDDPSCCVHVALLYGFPAGLCRPLGDTVGSAD